MGGEVKMKRVRTVTEDSGFGDEEGEHFVTDREFTIALEVVMTCQHFRQSDQPVTEKETRSMVEQMLPEEEEVREVIISRMEEVQRAGLSRDQLRAFIVDIQSMHQEAREVPILEDLEDLEDPEDLRTKTWDRWRGTFRPWRGWASAGRRVFGPWQGAVAAFRSLSTFCFHGGQTPPLQCPPCPTPSPSSGFLSSSSRTSSSPCSSASDSPTPR